MLSAVVLRRLRVLSLCVLTLAVLPAGRAAEPAGKINFADPPSGVFIDEWTVLELADMGRVGYGHNEISRTGSTINTQMMMSISLGRMGQTVRINIVQISEEKLDGTPWKFDHQLEASAQKLRVTGVIENGKVKTRASQFGVATENEYDFPAGALMTWGSFLEQHRRGTKPGTKYTIKAYDPITAANAALEVNVEIQDREPITVMGRTVEAIRSTQTMQLPGMPTGVTSQAWFNDDAQVLKSTISMMGLNFVMTLTTKEEALKDFSPPEFFAPTTIKVARPIDRQAARRIDYVLRPKDRKLELPPLPETGMQKAKPAADGAVELTVRRLDHAALKSVGKRDCGPEVREFLEPNHFINSDDPAVRAMAAEAKGDAKTPYEIADQLRRYVTDVIKDKNLNVGFASASEVCRNKEGDCSEHAVLLAALGRANGLPSRVAAGLVYVPVFGGQEDIFGFHMWTQFLLGDQWVDFDAAQRESDCNATHIAFCVNSLAASGLAQVAFPLVNVIGNLELEVMRIEPPPGESH